MAAPDPQILVVDDEAGVCSLISDALRQKNISCTATTRAEQVEPLLREKEFDVIISDICMPKVTGLELLEQIKNHCPASKTILITGHRRSDWAQQALRLGAFDYLEKPFEMDFFYATVNRALQERRAQSHRLDPRQVARRHFELLLTQEGTVQYVSENFAAITGFNPANALGCQFDALLGAGLDTDFETMIRHAGVSQKINLTLKNNGSRELPVELAIHAIAGEDRQPLYLVRIIDLSPFPDDRDLWGQNGSALWNQVGQDQLTGLPSHRAFQDELERIRYRCRRYGHTFSIMMLDVHQFKQLNGAHGYAAGDDVLVALGRMLRKEARMADHVSRFANDQFAVILPETDGDSTVAMAIRLRETVAKHVFQVDAKKLHIDLAVGIVDCRSGYIEGQSELINRAREALDYAKSSPNDKVILWGSSLGSGKTFDASCPDPVGASLATKRRRVNEHLRAAYMEMTRSLVAAVEAKDPFTKNHSQNVANYVEQVARIMGCRERQIEIMRCAATLHDIGKIGIPDAILTKPGKLTAEEFELIKQHAVIGADILSQSAFLSDEVLLVRHHHERYDGKGYPDEVAGEDIPLGSRLINVCDAIDCMFNNRSYKQGYNLDKVLDELQRNQGTQFDSQVAQIAIEFLQNHPEKIHYPD